MEAIIEFLDWFKAFVTEPALLAGFVLVTVLNFTLFVVCRWLLR